jgi:hypothetical protein
MEGEHHHKIECAFRVGLFETICSDEKMIIASEHFNSKDHFNGGLE